MIMHMMYFTCLTQVAVIQDIFVKVDLFLHWERSVHQTKEIAHKWETE